MFQMWYAYARRLDAQFEHSHYARGGGTGERSNGTPIAAAERLADAQIRDGSTRREPHESRHVLSLISQSTITVLFYTDPSKLNY